MTAHQGVRLAGHALIWDGLPFPQCSCGEMVPAEKIGQTKKAARTWHREHKAEVLDSWVAQGCDDRGREVHL